MRHQLKNRNFYIVLGIDLALFAVALAGAYLIRFEFALGPGHAEQILRLLPFFLGVKAAVFFMFRVYRGMFRYAGLADMWNLVRAVAGAAGKATSLMG